MKGHGVASSGEERGRRTMGIGVQVRRAPAAEGEKGPRTRWGFLRVQLRSFPLFHRGGGGCPRSGFLPGTGLIHGPLEGTRGGGAGMETRLGTAILEGAGAGKRVGKGVMHWRVNDKHTTFFPRVPWVSGAYL